MFIAITEDELDIRFKLLVEPTGVLSATPAELVEVDAKLGRRYIKWFWFWSEDASGTFI